MLFLLNEAISSSGNRLLHVGGSCRCLAGARPSDTRSVWIARGMLSYRVKSCPLARENISTAHCSLSMARLKNFCQGLWLVR
jgi:hypothetical protein